MQESNKVESAVHVKNEVKQDAFRVGDVVWCLVYGKGVITKILGLPYYYTFPVEVDFESVGNTWYTLDGKMDEGAQRTLFFSEPKIEASVTRPFVPTLVGKRVVVVPKFDPRLFTVFKEDSERIYVTEEGHYWDKDKIDELYEVKSENLLKL